MSKIEVNAIEPQCGTTLTVGASGDTITFPTGTTIVNNGTQTGFGRTGTVDWQTTPKTATFTAVNGEGYFCNTTSGTFEVDLPAGVAGAIVSIQDYNNTFDSNNLTVDPNGSEKINGGVAGGFITLSTEGLGLTFVYIDATVGWRSIQSNEYSTSGVNPAFICASVSGACNTLATVDTNFKVATFTGPGTFTVNSVGNPAGSTTVDYMVIAGAGGGGHGQACYQAAGGGGAGGYRESSGVASGSYTASPLGACVSALPVSVQGYSITIGAGGAGAPGGPVPNVGGATGSTSTFSTITSAGGGGGRGMCGSGQPGGSGGGAGTVNNPPGLSPFPVGTGNTPSTSPAQGTPGGRGTQAAYSGPHSGGGGGGATALGANGAVAGPGGAGGTAATSSINGTPTARAGGGGGSSDTDSGGSTTGGGGAGAAGAPGSIDGPSGTINTGGGGGGGAVASAPGNSAAGGAGGSGIVIIRYKFQ